MAPPPALALDLGVVVVGRGVGVGVGQGGRRRSDRVLGVGEGGGAAGVVAGGVGGPRRDLGGGVTRDGEGDAGAAERGDRARGRGRARAGRVREQLHLGGVAAGAALDLGVVVVGRGVGVGVGDLGDGRRGDVVVGRGHGAVLVHDDVVGGGASVRPRPERVALPAERLRAVGADRVPRAVDDRTRERGGRGLGVEPELEPAGSGGEGEVDGAGVDRHRLDIGEAALVGDREPDRQRRGVLVVGGVEGAVGRCRRVSSATWSWQLLGQWLMTTSQSKAVVGQRLLRVGGAAREADLRRPTAQVEPIRWAR